MKIFVIVRPNTVSQKQGIDWFLWIVSAQE